MKIAKVATCTTFIGRFCAIARRLNDIRLAACVLMASLPGTAYNAPMSISIREYMNAIDHLPEGATLVLQNLEWNDYERLIHDLTVSHARLRITYDRGRLEIMSPLREHEAAARFIDELVRAFADRFHLDVEQLGGTTWRRYGLQQGLEADCCYYVRNSERIIGLTRPIDLEIDPPPDVAVEIDITNESLSKFPIYAALKVGEIWRYDGKKLHFYELVNDSYRGIAESMAFPGLTPETLETALEHSKSGGQTAALAAFRHGIGLAFS